jgi:cytochrome c oxidase subunit IV
MSVETHDIQKEVKGYLFVFGGLLILTMVTVAASYLHLSLAAAITLALFIATIKASLVACYFMHLISEKKLIYLFLGFTVIFFFVLLLLPFTEFYSVPEGTHHVS